VKTLAALYYYIYAFICTACWDFALTYLLKNI